MMNVLKINCGLQPTSHIHQYFNFTLGGANDGVFACGSLGQTGAVTQSFRVSVVRLLFSLVGDYRKQTLCVTDRSFNNRKPLFTTCRNLGSSTNS